MVDAEETYSNVSSNLQNVLIVFLGFLLFISVFVFFPYYFLADTNKVVQNMDFLFNKMDDSLNSLKHTFQNYPQYKDQQLIPSDRTVAETNALKRNITMTVKQEMFQAADRNITNINNNLSAVESINNYYKIISDNDLDKMKEQISKIQNFTNNRSADLTINITMLEYENFLIFLPQKFYPDSVDQKKRNLEKDYADLAEGVTNLQIPIVGSGSFKLNQVLLLFPGIIAIGFPFISLQIKKILILNREINDKKKDLILSWLDPLQNWPDNAYAILTIFIPCIIFSIFLVCIYLLFYTNIQYTEQTVLNEKELLFLPKDTRDFYMFVNLLMGIVAFSFSYYLIFTEWLRSNRK